ncbi:MAG: VanZ family protein, partial [Lachnospiraceae bacterium]|nr:VanZ family protein [Lachnospiraceae bacterium]
MMTWLNSILEGIKIYGSIAPIVAVVLALMALASKKLNIVSFVIDHMAVAYIICVLMLVFFPLPTAERAAALCEYHGRFLPGSFIFDIAKEKSLESVLQVLFNIVMTIPFGMILTYRFNFSKKNVIFVSFLFSLFIEVGQLTGLFFTFNGSYRLYDADDLICNTLGGFIGFVVMNKVQLPAIANFTVSLKKRVAAI